METSEKQKILRSLIIPGILLALIWIVKIAEIWLKTDFSFLGLLPQHLSGLKGILFSPFLHADFSHLSANSVPLFLLTAGLFYFYPKPALKILGLLWLTTGFWVWIFAKDTGIHIGASGIVYALAGFHFTGGLLRREPRVMAFSLLVVFLYGSLIWGIVPDLFPEKNISWESHLLGLLAGVIIALFYREEGPQRKKYSWEEEDEYDEPDQEPEAFSSNESGTGNPESSDNSNPSEDTPNILYHYRKKTD